MPVQVCNDRTTSLRGRFSLVDIAVEGPLRPVVLLIEL